MRESSYAARFLLMRRASQIPKGNPVVMDLEENDLIKIKGNQIIMTKRGAKMLDYVTRSLIECYKGSDFHYF